MSARGALTSFMGAVRTVESNGDYRARNSSGASGAYQFMDGTWAGYGGYRHAADAPPEVQDRRAAQLMTRYHQRYGRWDLVAVAWHGGPGLANRARRDPSILRRMGDGSITTAEYVRRVMARVRPDGATAPGRPGRYGDPWHRPSRGLPLAGRTVSVDPDGLHRLARRLDAHLSTVDEAYRRCRREVGELGFVMVADGPLQVLLREALDRVVDDPDGLRRLPYLLSRDVAYVRDVRRRVLRADRPDTRVQPGVGRPGAGARPLASVHLGRSWAGTKSIFDQFVTPFLRRRGLRSGTRKWPNPNTGSDHRPEHTTAYAIDFPTRDGLGAARALAHAMGIRGWRPDTYGRHHVKVDGVWFRVQILWGARIDHADHVHVGIKRL